MGQRRSEAFYLRGTLMTSHELARLLLTLPDLPVAKHSCCGMFWVKRAEVETGYRYKDESVNQDPRVCYSTEIAAEDDEERFQMVTV